MVCLGHEQRSFCHFLITPKYCILDLFVDYEGYSTFSKEFLPTVVGIMAIQIKFPLSSPLSHWFLKCWCSLLPSPVWPLPSYLDSLTWHSRFLFRIALYSIVLCLHHQSHPQLGVVFALASLLHSFWSYFYTILQ